MLIYNYLKYNVTFNPIIKRITYGNSTLLLDGAEKYNPQIETWLQMFSNEIIQVKFDGPSSPADDYCEKIDKWQFWNAFLFTLSVVSTIGKLFFNVFLLN